MAAPTASSSPVGEEMHQLFLREEYESLLVRTDNLKKRKRLGDEQTKQLIQILRILSLIQLGRSNEAIPMISTVLPTLPEGQLQTTLKYAQLYTAWATNEGVENAVEQAAKISYPAIDSRKLYGQLLYRCGRYEEAGEIYERLFQSYYSKLQNLKQPNNSSASSRWGLISSSSSNNQQQQEQVTVAELERLELIVNELATNTLASYVLANKPNDVMRIKSKISVAYEIEYNNACANISQNKHQEANIGLQQAEQLIRTRLDMDDEEDIEEALVPIKVQKAYLNQLAGNLNQAKQTYEFIIEEGKADVASLAVAANNLTVTIGQLAFNKKNQQQSSSSLTNQLLPKEQHDALIEGLKKMKATSGKSIEKKLTINQRRSMAYNRAILLVQMGRMDTCRTELTKLKSQFSNDYKVALIEATLIAKQSGYDTADKVLQLAGNNNEINAARVQLAIMLNEYRKAADLLTQLFNGKPAAIVTAAALLEHEGESDKAISLLRNLADRMKQDKNKSNIIESQKALAQLLLKVKKYEDATIILKDILKQTGNDNNNTNTEIIAKLVVSTSYFDANEAESQAIKIVPMLDTKDVDVTKLENLPPPKRKQVAAMKNVSGIPTGKKYIDDDSYDLVAKAKAARERKKKKRKKRLPKDYDPNGPPPDPERWLPRTLRSDYKKKNKNRNDQNNFKGSQGADAAAVEAAAAKNAERTAAKAAAGSVASDSGRPRNQRRKKNRK